MGVDIYAYSNLRKVDAIAGEDYGIDPETREERPDWWRAYLNPDFPGRANDIEDRAYYAYDECIDAMSRSYGGYNRWRNQLAELADWPVTDENQSPHAASAWRATGGPFWELINFSDCEGVIGSKISAKLAKDFAEYQHKADAHPDEWFRKGYAGMRLAFELAANNGAVDFR